MTALLFNRFVLPGTAFWCRMRRICSTFGLVCCFLAIYDCSKSLANQPLPRSVLILDQSAAGMTPPGYVEIFSNIRSTLNAQSKSSIATHFENLNLDHFHDPRYEMSLRNFVQEKYREIPVGALVAMGSAALQFALQLRSEGWPEIPIVIAAADEESVTKLMSSTAARNVTGRILRFSLANSVIVARILVPRLKSLALVGDPLGKQPFRRHFVDELPQVAASLAVIDLTGLPLQEIRKRVAALPEDLAIVYTTVTRDDVTGAKYLPNEALSAIAEVANRPIVIDVDNRIGHGGTGGSVVVPAQMGQEAAQLVLRILDGEGASQIPIVPSEANRFVFDWRQLQRWKINENALPPGSEVRFRSPSIWDQYKWHMVGAVAICIVQAIFIAVLLVNQGRLRREHADRQRAEEAAHELSGLLINAQEEERSRLARELHDDVTQRMALLAIDAGREERKLSDNAGAVAMRTVREGLVRLSEDVHALSYRLHPSILEDLGLIEALKAECERYTGTCPVRLEANARELPEKMPRDVALCLFRIAQEGLRNTARHAKASRAEVRLRGLNGGLQLAVEDDGAGFNQAQDRTRRSLGLASMRQRVFLLGGQLEIASSPDQGTTIRAWVPLQEERSEPPARAAG